MVGTQVILHSFLFTILVNQGDGQFRDETNERLRQENPESGYWYKFVDVTDLNNDGFLDLVVVSGAGGGSQAAT